MGERASADIALEASEKLVMQTLKDRASILACEENVHRVRIVQHQGRPPTRKPSRQRQGEAMAAIVFPHDTRKLFFVDQRIFGLLQVLVHASERFLAL